jgi:hypothetical protein
MKVVQIQQNSEEWLEYRKGKSGGSEFKDLYITGLPLVGAMKAKLDELQIEYPKTAKAADLASLLTPETLAELKLEAEPKKRYYELIAERVARPITPNDYVDQLNGQLFSMMARGHILEPEALKAFEDSTHKTLWKDPSVVCRFMSCVWEREDNPSIYISPDAVIMPDEGTPLTAPITEAVEIKCLSNAETIKAFLTGEYPQEYLPQVIKYFVVNEDLEILYFVLYTDCIPGLELQIWKITREQIADKIAEAKAYEDAVIKLIDRDTARIAELGF